MSAYDWVKCPKGCQTSDSDITMRVDLNWNIDEDRAYVEMRFQCQVCDLTIKLSDTKKAKKVIREIEFEK